MKPLTASIAFATLRRFCEHRAGAGAFEKVREALQQQQHDVDLDRVFAPDAWYPTAVFLACIDIARDLLGPPNFYELYGEFGAEHEVNVLFRWVLRLTSPAFFLQRGAGMWGKFHDTGTWSIESAPRQLRGTLRDFGVVHPGYCRVVQSWMKRAAMMTGAREVQVTHPQCRSAGAEACVFVGEWR